ncbi:hypothetical protein [Thauera sp.]|uniref:hypothetical protein n=1 Tax=Thauera sp. TaxID=1905334 RepID=UPI002C32EF89|nr:hypothetical protein [Thauera sp.]HRP22430.1 hypothetical protein [Thauera sp.]
MTRTSIGAAMLALIAAALTCDPAAAASVPGTGVELQPPEGFTPSQRFPGFEHPAQGASIVVSEMPAGYAELRAAFSREGLASRGMELLDAKDVRAAGAQAYLAHVSQHAAGIEFRKWMLLAPRAGESVLVVGTFPRTAPAAFGEAVRVAVLSTALTRTGRAAPTADLPFHVEAGSRLKVAGRMGHMLLLNRNGSMTRTSADEPLYVVGPSLGRDAIDDLPRFAEQRAHQTAEISGLRGIQGRSLRVDGLAAYGIVADAKDQRSGLPLRFYQVIAPDSDGYFIFQGLVGSNLATEYLAEFRRLTDTFRRQPTPPAPRGPTVAN